MAVSERAQTSTERDVLKPPAITPKTILAVVCLVAGILAIFAAWKYMESSDALRQAAVVFAGLILMYVAFSLMLRILRGPRSQPIVWLSGAWVILLTLAAAFADFLPFKEHQDSSKTLGGAARLGVDLFSEHPLGTNSLGLDQLAQSVYGARVSLLIAFLTVIISGLVGVLIGIAAGYFRSGFDLGTTIVTDALLAFPPLVLLIALATILGQPKTVSDAIIKTSLALSIVMLPTMIRLARSSAMVFSQREFVSAARSIGAKPNRIIFRELLPNVMIPVASYSFILIAVLIIAEGSLSFLGLGLQQPQPTWGNMIAQATPSVMRTDPHIALVPGAFMFITVYSFNQLGEFAQRRWGTASRS